MKAWTYDEKSILGGRLTDSACARILGRTRRAVTAKRVRLGLPAGRKLRRLTADQIAMLGTASDKTLSRLWDMPAETIAQARRYRGIKPYPRRAGMVH